jgi:hypothetical protein
MATIDGSMEYIAKSSESTISARAPHFGFDDAKSKRKRQIRHIERKIEIEKEKERERKREVEG